MAGSYINSTNLGLPVATHVLGASDFIISVALFQVLLVTPVILLLIEVTSGNAGRRWMTPLLAPVRNPIVLAALAGVVVALTGWRVPAHAMEAVRMLGAAAVPTGLFVLGMSLHRSAEVAAASRWLEVAATVALKLLAQPILAAVVGAWLGLRGYPLWALVLCSGLPTAQNTFLFANQYRLATRFTRDVVFVSTLLSMITLVIITWVFAGTS